jgi:hypothetical protein
MVHDRASFHQRMITYDKAQIGPALITRRAHPGRYHALVVGATATSPLNSSEKVDVDGAACLSDVTDLQWERIRLLLPPLRTPGRPRAEPRRTLNGILYVLTTHCAWHTMPRHYGSYTTCWRRLFRWQRQGIWRHIQHVLATPLTEEQ